MNPEILETDSPVPSTKRTVPRNDPCGMLVWIGVDGAVNSSRLRVVVRSQRKDVIQAMIL
jgi:hypothetical protein